MRFSFLYLFAWAHSSRLSACFLLYVLWPQCPLPLHPTPVFSILEYLQVQICVHICPSTNTAWFCVSLRYHFESEIFCASRVFTSMYENVFPHLKCMFMHSQSERQSRCLGINGFEDIRVIFCVQDVLSICCTYTKKQLISFCCWTLCLKTSQIMQDTLD